MATAKKTATAKPIAKAVAAKVEDVKEAAPVVAEKKEEVKKEAPVKKAPAKKAASAKKAAPAKKETPEKKVVAKKEATLYVQFADKSYSTEELVKIAEDVWVYDLGKKASDIKTVEIYVKPEESRAYFVVNGTENGSFLI